MRSQMWKNEVGIDKKFWNKNWWHYSIAQQEIIGMLLLLNAKVGISYWAML